MRMERLHDMMVDRDVLRIGKVLQPEKFLRLFHAVARQHRAFRLFIDDIILCNVLIVGFRIHFLDFQRAQRADKALRLLIQLVRLSAAPGYDQRRARLVDENGVDLVHDGEMIASLRQLLLVSHHVVAQIIEADLVIGSVGDVRRIGRTLFR